MPALLLVVSSTILIRCPALLSSHLGCFGHLKNAVTNGPPLISIHASRFDHKQRSAVRLQYCRRTSNDKYLVVVRCLVSLLLGRKVLPDYEVDAAYCSLHQMGLLASRAVRSLRISVIYLLPVAI